MTSAGERLLSIACLLLVCAGLATADDAGYTRRVKPILKEKCFSCHGAVKQEAGLRLDAAELIHKGGENGSVITAGKPDASLILKRMQASGDEQMPPPGEGEPATAAELEIISSWIAAGAPVPPDEEYLTDPLQHWTYRKPVAVPLPEGIDPAWTANPVDAFIAAKQREVGLVPAKAADKALLLRRITLDLTGLPPTPEEQVAFLKDESPEAYAKVVDRLLASPAYGERWGRHWMDVWRYSDWDGFGQEVRNSQRHIWHWRDWIVESLNEDKGYDRMVQEMLAADELQPGDLSALRATGFLARNYNRYNRDLWMDAAVEHTAKAFLGVTLACARCHDHKYDPIPQTDYYQFRAIFEPYEVRTDRLQGEKNLTKNGIARIFDKQLETRTFLYKRGNEKDPDKEHPLQPAVPASLGGEFVIKPVDLPLSGWFPDLRDDLERDDLAAQEAAVNVALAQKELQLPADDPARKLADLRLELQQDHLKLIKARWAAERASVHAAEGSDELARQATWLERMTAITAAQVTLQERQIALAAGEVAAEKEPADSKNKPDLKKLTASVAEARKKLDEARLAIENPEVKYTPIGERLPKQSSGRRLALARWITDTNNPVTARVAVNQMWLRHFGTPLVDLVVDFGLNSPRPEHLALLDRLAIELMTGGETGRPWSMKHVHRLIVTSQTYQRSSSPQDAPASNTAIDPDNRFYWRANVRRLEGEIVRDCILAAAGSLDMTRGGPDIDFNKGEEVLRRSLYFQTAYEKQMLMLTIFDGANPADCYRRSDSVIPQQALALANSTLIAGQARTLAARLSESADYKADDAFVKQAFRLILNREARPEELSACQSFLTEQAGRLSKTDSLTPISGGAKPTRAPSTDSHQRSRENLILVLFNHNDCVTVR